MPLISVLRPCWQGEADRFSRVQPGLPLAFRRVPVGPVMTSSIGFSPFRTCLTMAKRRRFVALLGGAFSTTLLLAGCLGNPPSRSGRRIQAPIPVAKADVEVKTINLGFVPILESAPLVIGVEKGFFAKHGLEVQLSKQSSWSTARDNVVLGSGGGGNDGGQWQLPMPQMISEGVITNGKKVPMTILAMLMSQGNGIAAANTVKNGNLTYDLKASSPGFF